MGSLSSSRCRSDGAVELHMAAINGHADHEVVGVVQDFVLVAWSDPPKPEGGAVDLAERRAGRNNEIAGTVARGHVIAET